MSRALFFCFVFSLYAVSACSSLKAGSGALPTLAATAPALSTAPMVSRRLLLPTFTPAVVASEPATPDGPGPADISTASPDLRRETRQPTPTAHTPTQTASPGATVTPEPTPTQTATQRPSPLLPNTIWPSPTPHPFPIADGPRHGVAVAFGPGGSEDYGRAPYSWSYSYSAFVPEGNPPVEHVPMLTGRPANGIPDIEFIKEMDRRSAHNYWLVFNECEQHWQCNTQPDVAADFYYSSVIGTLYGQGADADAQLIVGGVNAHICGIRWLEQFLAHYEANYGQLPRAGWHFHLYPEVHPSGWPSSCDGGWNFDDTIFPDVGAAINLWQSHTENIKNFVRQFGRPEDEIWITETGCLNYGFHQEQRKICQTEGFIETYAPWILSWLNSEGRWITRYAWFTNWNTGYWDVTKLLSSVEDEWQYSSLGWYFTNIRPAAAVPLDFP